MPRRPRDPLAAVLGLGNRHAGVGLAVAVAGTLVVHGAGAARGLAALLDLAGFSEMVHRVMVERLRAEQDVDIEREKPKIEPEQEEPEEEEPEKPLPAPPSGPPPVPAEAGKVLTAEPDPDPEAPLDLTGDSWKIVTGDGRYRGGVTSAKGTSKRAVHSRHASNDGVPGGKGAKPAPKPRPKPKKDRSASPKLRGGSWSCGFPPEADAAQINSADAYIVVTVGPSGKPKSVAVTVDPGHGFGRLARSCALGRRFQPGLDADGRPTTKTLGPIRVRFRR